MFLSTVLKLRSQIVKKPIILITAICFLYLAAIPATGWSSGWGWKKATDPDDVLNFINGQSGYKQPVKTFEVAAAAKEHYTEFIVFYQFYDVGEIQKKHLAAWGWKKALNLEDALAFLNGRGKYLQTVGSVKIVSVQEDTGTEYFVFYRRR